LAEERVDIVEVITCFLSMNGYRIFEGKVKISAVSIPAKL
jgi:hypothetical protein